MFSKLDGPDFQTKGGKDSRQTKRETRHQSRQRKSEAFWFERSLNNTRNSRWKRRTVYLPSDNEGPWASIKVNDGVGSLSQPMTKFSCILAVMNVYPLNSPVHVPVAVPRLTKQEEK